MSTATQLRVISGRHQDRIIPLTAPLVTIGRATDNSVVLAPEIAASRHHAEFSEGDETWTVRDLGSLNGTFVNGERPQELPLHPRADEINRTQPKTQAALLEAMLEAHVTAAGETYPLEQEGTYPLPEAQLDRFMFSLRVDYPSEAGAGMRGSLVVNCNDIRAAAPAVLRHRMFTNFAADSEGVDVDGIIAKVLKEVQEPGEREYQEERK